MGRVLHDGHHRDDRRLPGSPRRCRAPARCSPSSLLLGGVGAALYTFTLLATVVVEGGLPKRLQRRRHERMLDDHQRSLHHLRLRPHRQHRRPAVPAAEGAVRRHRARSASGCRPRSRTARSAVEADASREDVLKRVGIERARGLIAAVGTDAENVYAVLSARVLRPDLFIVGRAETEDATREAEARRRRPRDLAVSDRRACRWRRRRCGRRSSISSSWRPAPTTSSWRWKQITIAPGSALAEPIDARGQPAPAIRRHRGRHPARRTAAWSSTPSRTRAIRAGDKLVVLGRPESLKRLEAEAAERR